MTSQLLQRPGKIALTISLLLPLIAGCTTTHAVDNTSYSTTAAQSSFSDAQLDSLLAPIALYPDTVLSHVLIASTYPLEVVEADRWARNNTHLTGDNAVNSVENKDWDPSVKALVAFPEVLKRMSSDLDWTQQLGDAFLASEERVMDSIQKLRNRAYASGNLDNVEHVRVVREDKVIVIEPSVERVVYVPAYDTRVVYGNWWWADYPPVYWHYPSSYVFVSGFYWGPRVYIGPQFYFSGCHWHQRRVVVVDHHHHHHHRFYDSRSVAHYSGSRHWHHNPVHRRGVAYHDNHTRERFHSTRESYGDSRQYRDELRNQHRANSGVAIAPTRGPNYRPSGDDHLQRLDRRQAGQITANSANVSNERRQAQQPRDEQLRERMNARTGRDLGNVQNRTHTTANTQRPENQSVDLRQTNRRIEAGQQQPRTRDERVTSGRGMQIDRAGNSQPNSRTHSDNDNNQINRNQLPRYQSEVRSEPIARVDRPTERVEQRSQPIAQVERREAPRAERVERIDRSERVERANSGMQHPGNRAEMRGGRER